MSRSTLRRNRRDTGFNIVSFIAAAIILISFALILLQGYRARTLVVDVSAVGSILAENGSAAANTLFDATNGSASIGLSPRSPSTVTWTIPIEEAQPGPLFLSLLCDEPQFFSADGSASIIVGSRTIEVIRSRPTTDSTYFVADLKRQSILIPPARAVGYRLPLDAESECPGARCIVSVRGTSMFWHVFRLAITSEPRRFRVTER